MQTTEINLSKFRKTQEFDDRIDLPMKRTTRSLQWLWARSRKPTVLLLATICHFSFFTVNICLAFAFLVDWLLPLHDQDGKMVTHRYQVYINIVSSMLIGCLWPSIPSSWWKLYLLTWFWHCGKRYAIHHIFLSPLLAWRRIVLLSSVVVGQYHVIILVNEVWAVVMCVL